MPCSRFTSSPYKRSSDPPLLNATLLMRLALPSHEPSLQRPYQCQIHADKPQKSFHKAQTIA
ncbi:hypothetical protein A9741_02020 [Campylobacter upsaliensis]|nr:hypothetical protein [Campylobacter upsaliensis]